MVQVSVIVIYWNCADVSNNGDADFLLKIHSFEDKNVDNNGEPNKFVVVN